MSDSKPTFFTSDWHLGHEKILEFDKRPFRNIEHMHSVIINNYNASVPKDGICYHLGDVGFGNVETTKNVLAQLNGTKVLILGNHDRGMSAMYRLGFDVVLYNTTLYIAQEKVTLSHCPLLGVYREDVTRYTKHDVRDNWHGENRPKYTKFTMKNEGQFHLHGHIHSYPGKGVNRIEGRQYDIGVPGNNYRPVSISQIESFIVKTKMSGG